MGGFAATVAGAPGWLTCGGVSVEWQCFVGQADIFSE